MVNTCPMYLAVDESDDHLLLNCRVAHNKYGVLFSGGLIAVG